jgi:tetratricopeptide (TPR) repeat protein/transcriptional regulator with XRE-family HTH domain
MTSMSKKHQPATSRRAKAERVPNEQLKTQRLKRNWTQVYVATMIGTSDVEVSRWETGTAEPGLHFREKLCELFGTAPEALGLLPPAQAGPEGSIQALPWNVPARRNPLFTGREEVLTHLHSLLHSSKIVALTQVLAISGLGGIGKTQTAIEYAYRHRDDYSAVLWVKADTREVLASDFAALAHILHLAEQDEQDQHRAIQAVRRWLLTHSGWLLILDNVEDVTMFHELPSTEGGCVLLTTRSQVTGPFVRSLDLEQMTPEEGAIFLLRRAKLVEPQAPLEQASQENQDAAKAISRLLDGLPLALDQAGAYIEETGCGLSGYIERYQAQQATLLKRRGDLVIDHPASVTTTFSLAFARVEQTNQTASDLLRVCAMLDADAIPEELLLAETSEPGTMLEPLARDALALDEALGVLRRSSLITRHTDAGLLSMHRLVQVVLQSQMDQSTYQYWAHKAIETVNRCFPPVELLTTWSQCQRLLPHALACATLIEQEEIISEAAGRLLHRIGMYLLEWARYAQAGSYLTRASLILRQVLGEEHLVVAESLNHQAELAYFQGDYPRAEHLHRQALRIREQQLGPRHVQTATSLNHLAASCWIQGKYRQAEPLYQRAFHIREELLGGDHLDTGETLLNLAALFLDQERYSEAEPLLERCLKIFQQMLGPDHLYLMTCWNELGRLYHAQGRYEEARQLYQQAKTLGEQAHATHHPFYAITLNRLARLACSEGAWTQAEAWYRQALEIWEDVQGPPKPRAQILHNLAVLSQQRGWVDQALDLYQQALALREKALPPDHPDTAETLHDLAHFHYLQQRNEEARSLYQQALAIREQVFGPHHPKTEATRAAYVHLLREMGHEDEAARVEHAEQAEQESAT